MCEGLRSTEGEGRLRREMETGSGVAGAVRDVRRGVASPPSWSECQTLNYGEPDSGRIMKYFKYLFPVVSLNIMTSCAYNRWLRESAAIFMVVIHHTLMPPPPFPAGLWSVKHVRNDNARFVMTGCLSHRRTSRTDMLLQYFTLFFSTQNHLISVRDGKSVFRNHPKSKLYLTEILHCISISLTLTFERVCWEVYLFINLAPNVVSSVSLASQNPVSVSARECGVKLNKQRSINKFPTHRLYASSITFPTYSSVI